MAEQTVEQRLERLERLADRLADLAREHPIGRVILRKLGLQ